MNFPGKIIIISLVLLLFAGFFFRFQQKDTKASPDYRVIKTEKRSFDIRVETVGILDAARSHTVSSDIRGDKGKIIYLVEDGKQVIKGEELVRLDPTPFEEEKTRLEEEARNLQAGIEAAGQVLEWEKNQVEREIQSAEYRVTIAELELKKLINGDGPLRLSQLEEDLQKAEEEALRYKTYIRELMEISEKGFGTDTEILMAKRKYRDMEKRVESAKKQYESYRDHVLPSQEQSARAQVEKARTELNQIETGSVYKIAKSVLAVQEAEEKLKRTQSELEMAKRDIENTVLYAPFAGIVILYETYRSAEKRKPRVGDRVIRNQPLLYLPDISEMIIDTQVREAELHRIQTGQFCHIRVDAFPNDAFKGKVTFVGVLAKSRFQGGAGEKYFQLQVSVEGKNQKLRPGMTARVSIHTDRVKNRLAVPISAVFTENSKEVVYKKAPNGFVRVEVETGRQNADLVEITKGLKENDRVCLVKPGIEDIL